MTLEYGKTTKIKQGFSKRLMQAMIDKGFESPKDPKKANTQKLATASGVSRQMASRYLSSDSIPVTEVLHRISDWLTCDPWWLLYGSKKESREAPNKIACDIFKFIIAEMQPLIAAKAENSNEFNFLFDNILDIYNNLTEIDADIESKKKSASIMINFIKSQYKPLSQAEV